MSLVRSLAKSRYKDTCSQNLRKKIFNCVSKNISQNLMMYYWWGWLVWGWWASVTRPGTAHHHITDLSLTLPCLFCSSAACFLADCSNKFVTNSGKTLLWKKWHCTHFISPLYGDFNLWVLAVILLCYPIILTGANPRYQDPAFLTPLISNITIIPTEQHLSRY